MDKGLRRAEKAKRRGEKGEQIVNYICGCAFQTSDLTEYRRHHARAANAGQPHEGLGVFSQDGELLRRPSLKKKRNKSRPPKAPEGVAPVPLKDGQRPQEPRGKKKTADEDTPPGPATIGALLWGKVTPVTFPVSHEVLMWYEFCVNDPKIKCELSIGEFISGIVNRYFTLCGYEPAIIVRRRGDPNGQREGILVSEAGGGDSDIGT